MCATYTQHERFGLAKVLFHTLFNRTVENFHTRFTFVRSFYLQLASRLHCQAILFFADDCGSQSFALEILFESSVSRLSQAAGACYDFFLPQITRTK
jgi:hypothetical protein